jgi:uncharacterized protein (TIGR03083 family)
MEPTRLREHLGVEFDRLRAAAAGADPAAPVPSCPGWTLAQLLRHVGITYLHKVESMRSGAEPDPWPPAGAPEAPPLELLDRGYAALVAELDRRDPGEPSPTWYDPDQTVGFWYRRMPHETLIHRVDAELAAGTPPAPVSEELAEDGIDEVLGFLTFAVPVWPGMFAETLRATPAGTVRLATPARHRTVSLTGTEVHLRDTDPPEPDTTVTGTAADLLLWLWGRRPQPPPVTGDPSRAHTLRTALTHCE